MSFWNIVESLLATAIENKHYFAIWKNPLQEQFYCIFSNEASKQKPAPGIGESGFVIAPFNANYNDDSLLIKPTIFIHSYMEMSELEKVSLTIIPQNIDLSKLIKLDIGSEISQRAFEINIQKSIDTINDSSLKKVVFSRFNVHDYPEKYSLLSHYQLLASTYNEAFVAMHFSPEYGLWLGASPELLLSLDEKGIFTTVALAGTQAFCENTDLKEAIWKQKEIVEQALVSRYIIDCLKHLRVREFEEHGPKTVKAAKLIHLKTVFTVDTAKLNYRTFATEMLQLLHPTSAVCGMPKQEAINFITQYEGYNRHLFAGYIGPVNIQNNSALYVNLRCMHLQSDKVFFFAGAGITDDSIPEKEWKETGLKIETMKSVFFNLSKQ